jgi:uncharacterized delta-60 repeat protein
MKYLILFIAFFFTSSQFFGQAVIKVDSSFNLIGYHTLNLNSINQSGNRIKKGPIDNKYVVRAYANANNYDEALVKYKRDGTLDSGFNSVGYRFQLPPFQDYSVNGELIIDNQDRIINGAGRYDLTDNMAIMRTSPNGLPDASFGVNGVYKVPDSHLSNGALTMMPDSSFILTCISSYWINTQIYYDLRLSKLKKNFTIDSAFGTNGTVFYPFGWLDCDPGDVQIYPNGNFLLPITVRTRPFDINIAYDYDIKLMRFKPNGNFDSTFGVNGIATPYYGADLSEIVSSTAILSDNKIILAGEAEITKGNDYGLIARYLENGAIDSSFGVWGKSNKQLTPNTYFNINVQKDNKIICTGDLGYKIMRLREDGFGDVQFGAQGFFASPFTVNSGGFPFGALLENDTTLLVTGNAFQVNHEDDVTTARYKIQYQPYVTGVKTNYCMGGTSTGTIINMPLPGSDTLVSVLLDNVAIPFTPAGVFTVTLSTVGQHLLIVKFTKGSSVWKETITMNVLTPPIADAGLDKSICNGSVTLGIIAPPNNFYSWASNPAGFSSTMYGPTVSPTVTTQYFLTVSNGACISRDTVVVNYGSLIANAGADKSICPGTSTTIGSTGSAGNNYSWISIPAGFTSTIATPFITPTAQTSYILTITSGTCVAKDTVVISMSPAPVADAGPDRSICLGGSTGVTIGTTEIAGNTYSWSPTTGLNTPTVAQPLATPTNTTTYTLTVTNSVNCKATDNVIVSRVPGFSLTLPDTLINHCLGRTSIIGNQAQSGYSYNWTSIPAGFSSTVSNPVISPTVNTIYNLTQTSTATGCQATAHVNVTVVSCLFDVANIYPNPSTSNSFTIELAGSSNEKKHFTLTDSKGVVVFTSELQYRTTVNTQKMEPGIYFYSIKSADGEKLKSGKIIIQH